MSVLSSPTSTLLTTPLSLQSILFPFSQYPKNIRDCHLYSPNPRTLLLPPYQCLTTIQNNRQEQCFTQHPHTLKQMPIIHNGSDNTLNFLHTAHLPTKLGTIYSRFIESLSQIFKLWYIPQSHPIHKNLTYHLTSSPRSYIQNLVQAIPEPPPFFLSFSTHYQLFL